MAAGSALRVARESAQQTSARLKETQETAQRCERAKASSDEQLKAIQVSLTRCMQDKVAAENAVSALEEQLATMRAQSMQQHAASQQRHAERALVAKLGSHGSSGGLLGPPAAPVIDLCDTSDDD